MKDFKLLTWLDIRRIFRRKTNYGTNLPENIVSIRCFSDAVEINISDENCINKVNDVLKEWFEDSYQQEESMIQLDVSNATLPVEFISEEEPYITDIEVRPFWEEIAYLESDSETETAIKKIVKLPEPYTEKLSLIAFYSFKGGVGRTLNLAAHLFALLDRAKELNKSIKVLVIDADLEAPGLTYWNDSSKRKQPEVSFINFLEIYHYSPIDREEALALFANEVKKSVKHEGNSQVYFLPAFLKDNELLDMPILPEHLVRGIDGTWEYGNAIHHLGEILGVDYVFIDLRAGLSEISSPIIFDPRIQRFLVTTINDQSIKGTSLVLKQIGKVAPSKEEVNKKIYYDPAIIISMLKTEFKELPNYINATTDLESNYVQSKEPTLIDTRLNTQETDFNEKLLYIHNWEDARSKLKETTVIEKAIDWASQQLINAEKEVQTTKDKGDIKSQQEQQVTRLRDLCQKYELAESGEGEDLLITEPLQNLATNFRDELPHVISIGAKGAGKTFNYIQLSRFKYWGKFLNSIDKNETSSIQTKTYILPFLESSNLKNKAKTVISEARNEVRAVLDVNVPEFVHSEYTDRIKTALTEQNWDELQWTEFWVNEIARAIGINQNLDSHHTLSSINQDLKNKGLKIIFLFDGLEDIFPKIASNDQQQKALKALIDDLPKKLSEIRQSHLGIIIFLRRDFLRYTITQNLRQFENLYRSYDLSWNEDSFLKLVYWICSESNIIGAKKDSKDSIYSLSQENLVAELEKLWGKRLGAEKSKEAYTASWVFAALTDFKGRLQARDIVRFLYYAAKITVDNAKEIQFEKWSTSRLLPPQAIRRALKPCSEEKVKEAKEEYPTFKTWVEETLPPQSERKIPFAVEKFNIDQQTMGMLEEMGVIYEDTAKEDIDRFYMPEIFREGLGFSGQGARPRIVALKRRVLGKGIFANLQ
ncbi:MAG: ParA family protein [Dolichospermum sp. LBC05a]|nr:ParA family protein [Dolichospermum sp. OL01]MCO5795759.1 ParA family protein [Dolichospermum sp. OL03]MCS6281208.1 ParA family protein [Dolichospermum sp.]QSV57429.1 MAG: ParA family protein [Dolichospermum sp. LBC05a]